MRVAIISDTHDNIWQLDKAIPHLQSVDAVLHCGDLCSPFIIVRLGSGAKNIPVHIVWGNNDGDLRALTTKANEAGNITLHGHFANLTLGGLSIAMNHYPEIARPLAASDQFDLVCYGHDHTAHEERIGDTLLVNPGDVMGLYGRSSMVIFETTSRKISWIDLGK